MKVHLPGTHLGQFEVVSYLMTSDVCIEYTCLDHVRARPVLLKALRPELLASQPARDSFVKSGMAWAGLGTHSHIPWPSITGAAGAALCRADCARDAVCYEQNP